MKVVKRENQNWKVEITSETGKTHEVDLGTTDRDEAVLLLDAAKVEKLERAANAHQLTQDVVSLIINDRKTLCGVALKEYDNWMGKTFRSKRTHHNTITLLKKWLHGAGGRDLYEQPVTKITEDDINGYVNDPKSEVKSGTRSLRLCAIRGFLNFSMHRRYVMKDVSQEIAVNHRILSHKQKEVTHKKVFEEDEVEFMIVKAGEGIERGAISKGFFKAAIILARDLALRLSDICNLEWDSFDFAKRTCTVWTGKGNSRVELPMTRRVIKLLSAMNGEDSKYLFPSERAITNSPVKRALLPVTFGRFLKSIGFEGYSFHSLRATYATTMANEGMTMQEISEALGHKGTTVTKAYVRNPNAAKTSLR